MKKKKSSKETKDISSYFPKKPVVNPIQPKEEEKRKKEETEQEKIEFYLKNFGKISSQKNMEKKQPLFVAAGENPEGVSLQETLLKENPAKEMNTTLSNVTVLIDEIDRNTDIPAVKEPAIKSIPLTVTEYVKHDETDKEKIDMNRIRTLMSQLSNDDILELFGQKYLPVYLAMKKAYEARVKELQKTNPNLKVSSAKFRKLILDLPSVIHAFMANGKLVSKTYESLREKVIKHNEKVAKNKELLIAKKQASALVKKPKRKFLGALLSKISPKQYREALQDFNDAEKGKGLHKYSNLTPGKMIKELERRAYADFIDPETKEEKSNSKVAKILADPDSYKADDVSQGVKKRMKDIEARLADKTEEEKEADKEYKDFVKPHKDYKLNESAIISDVRAMLAKGMKPEEIKDLLEPEEKEPKKEEKKQGKLIKKS